MAERDALSVAVALSGITIAEFWQRSLAFGCEFLDETRTAAVFADPSALTEAEARIANLVVNEKLLESGLPMLTPNQLPQIDQATLQALRPPAHPLIGQSRSVRLAARALRDASKSARQRSTATRAQSTAIRTRVA